MQVSEARLKQLRKQYPEMAKHGDRVLIEYSLSKLEELEKKSRNRPKLPNFL